MNKIKIKFNSPEEVTEFVDICNCFISDINVWDGHITLDAKSVVSMFGIAEGKYIDVEMISSDKDEISRFIIDINKFEVKIC